LLTEAAMSGPRGIQDFKAELRVCRDHGENYTLQQFINFYGVEEGLQTYTESAVYSVGKRWADDGWAYSLAQFEEWYGQPRGRALWNEAPVADISLLLRAVADVERRAALHGAYLRQFPQIRTPCCGAEFCFRCQRGSWHEGRTCEEMLEAPIQLQFCTGCSVPTQRTEGCSNIVCLCGTHWNWKG